MKKEQREKNQRESTIDIANVTEKKSDIVAMMKQKQELREWWSSNWVEVTQGEIVVKENVHEKILDDRIVVPPSAQAPEDSELKDSNEWEWSSVIDPPLPPTRNESGNQQWVLVLDDAEWKLENEVLPSTILDEPVQKVHLAVPFWSQAPEKDWNQPWQDACEEASIIQSAHYVKWVPLDSQKMKQEILKLVDVQNDLFWDYVDTTIQQTKELYLAYYGSWDRVEIIQDPSIDQMKEQLEKWRTIVTPLAWKLLKNKFYTDGWPRYHMLTVVWYDETWFITNDVWTKNWEWYHYPYERFMSAIHDFVPVWNIISWEKKILVIWKKE